ncbi:MAG TPA: methionyl-tRNA formyltransferase [Acidobacteriota bacterium]|nr:methionyl-tRNA formyltransferase [Acidobacteriota bacterium]
MRIVFFGSPEAALPTLRRVLEEGHSVELVVTQPDKPAGRGRKLTPCPVKRFATERGLPVVQPVRVRKDEGFLERLAAARPDVNVVVAYGQIMPGPVIYLPPDRSLNVHFSLLPRYRGASPVAWAILRGETMTGVTIFELNERMDEGDVLAREATDIGLRETARELESRLAEIGAWLMARTLADIGAARRVPQTHADATLAPKLRKGDGLIDWTADAGAIDRKVRAFDPWPTAFSFLGGVRLQVRRGLPSGAAAGGREPGTVIAVGKSGLDIACGGGTVYRIERLRPEGKAEMDAHAFALGGHIRPGDIFGPS